MFNKGQQVSFERLGVTVTGTVEQVIRISVNTVKYAIKDISTGLTHICMSWEPDKESDKDAG